MEPIPQDDSVSQETLHSALKRATSAFLCQSAFIASEKPRIRETITPCGLGEMAFDVGEALAAIQGIAECVSEDMDTSDPPSDRAFKAFRGMLLIAKLARPNASALAEFTDAMTSKAS